MQEQEPRELAQPPFPTQFESPFSDEFVQFAQTITKEEFETIRAFAFKHAGIAIADYKQNMVFGRVIKRLRALRIPSITDYLEHLDGPKGRGEIQFLVNALTTNKTSFFRESHHFVHLTETFFPEKISAIRAGAPGRIRLWSAGCSSGEEAYSIAMTSLSSLAAPAAMHRNIDLKILSTDIDTHILEKAKSGVYPADHLDDIPERLARIYMRRVKNDEALCSVRDFVRNHICFKYLNLIGEWPMKGPFDAIFCRNVVIYFNKETQRVLFDRFAEMLPMGGYLYIGHSESLHRVSERFENVGQSIYRRVI